MADFDLNAFLASQEAEGVSQGLGNFTISHEKASQKMSQYSLPREHAWVLKLVQAAVGWGCSKLTLKQSRTASTFAMELGNSTNLPSNRDLITAILKADLESQEPLESLATALRVLVEKAHLSFLLMINDGSGDAQAIYAGVYFAEMDEVTRAKQRKSWGTGVTLRIHHIPHTDANRLLLNYIPIRRHGLPMLAELEEYAYVCPVPIYASGRRIDGVLRSSHLKWNYHRKPVRLAGFEIPGDDDPDLEICDDFGNLVLTVHSSLLEIARDKNLAKFSEAYCILSFEVPAHSLGTQRPSVRSKISWVRNGVIVEEHSLPILTKFLSLHLFVSAEGLSTDLTGFQLQRNDLHDSRRMRLLSRAAEVLELERRAERDILLDPIPDSEKPSKEIGDPDSPFPLIAVPSRLLTRLYESVEKTWTPSVDWEMTGIKRRYPKELQQLIEEIQKIRDGAGVYEVAPLDIPKAENLKGSVSTNQIESEEKSADSVVVKEKFTWAPPD